VQANVVPRVIEVLPGFPAEAAGVRKGFVLTEVADEQVDANTWFDKFQSATMPFTLTFDTDVPLHSDNPFIEKGEQSSGVKLGGGQSGGVKLGGAVPPAPPPLPEGDFVDFRCDVVSVPFGLQIRAPRFGYPSVVGVTPGLPAEKAGVRISDVLVEVAGRPVTSESWFSAFQQAAAPFGLRFRRPKTPEAAQALQAAAAAARKILNFGEPGQASASALFNDFGGSGSHGNAHAEEMGDMRGGAATPPLAAGVPPAAASAATLRPAGAPTAAGSAPTSPPAAAPSVAGSAVVETAPAGVTPAAGNATMPARQPSPDKETRSEHPAPVVTTTSTVPAGAALATGGLVAAPPSAKGDPMVTNSSGFAATGVKSGGALGANASVAAPSPSAPAAAPAGGGKTGL